MNSKIQKEKGGSQDDKVYKLLSSLYSLIIIFQRHARNVFGLLHLVRQLSITPHVLLVTRIIYPLKTRKRKGRDYCAIDK